jgi:hypothetical protein
MSNDTIPIAEAIKRLSDASSINNNRLTELETKLADIHTKITQHNTESNGTETNDTDEYRNQLTNRMDNIQSEMKQLQEETKKQVQKQQSQWDRLTGDVRCMKEELKKICEAILSSNIAPNDKEDIVEESSITIHRNDGTNLSIEGQTSPSPLQPITQTIIMPPTSAIPVFSGNLSENPRQFLIRVREYTETVNRWDEGMLLNGISQFLRETALEWYCQIRMSPRKPRQWSEFSILFLNQFNSPIRRARQEEEWRKCKQEENETINEFIVRLRALWREQKPNECENDLVKHLMCKMRNNVLNMIGVSRCESVDEIISEAQRVEEILYQRAKQGRSNDYTSDDMQGNFLSTTRNIEETTPEIQAMSAHRNNQYMRTQPKRNYVRTAGTPPQYYANEQSYGYHQSNRSAYVVTCTACGKRGHTQAQCRGQQGRYQRSETRYYPKNENGAQERRI